MSRLNFSSVLFFLPAGHELAMCAGSPEGQPCPGQHQEKIESIAVDGNVNFG